MNIKPFIQEKPTVLTSAQEILNVPVMEYRKHFNSDADFEQFLNIAKVINGIDNTRTPIDNPAWFFMIPVVAIAVAAVELMVAVDQYVTIIGETRSTQDRVMKLWYDKNNVLTAEESLLFYDAAIIDRIDNLVYAAKSEYKNLNEDALRSFLIVNYVKYYGL